MRKIFIQDNTLQVEEKTFNGKVELDKTPLLLSEKEIYSIVTDINVQLDKKFKINISSDI
jgi:uncharacterized protein YunC (DUF1805 family)